jgi:cytochrome c oxidase cbb3-type subunit 3
MRTLVIACVVAVAAPAGLRAQERQFDQAAVDRGRELLVNQCGFCHGSNARGGSSGPDLTRSELVQSDEGGRQLGAFLAAGRPDKGMPAVQLAPDQVKDLAEFLHANIYLNANRRLYKILDILVGDPTAGQAYFNGAGKCSTCHSPTGDLAGVGRKYEPVALQQKFLMPRGGRGEGPPKPAYMENFDVTVFDPATSQQRTFARNGDVPRVEVVDPLQAHLDQWSRWTDDEIHNMTAYLASLK